MTAAPEILGCVSEENVERIRRVEAAFNRGDLDALVGELCPDAEWEVSENNPAARTLHGRAEIRAYLEDWRDTVRGLPDLSSIGRSLQTVTCALPPRRLAEVAARLGIAGVTRICPLGRAQEPNSLVQRSRTRGEALGLGVGVEELHVLVWQAHTHLHTLMLPWVVPVEVELLQRRAGHVGHGLQEVL